MVGAGPAFNLLAACACALALRLRPRGACLRYFLWLSCAFNLLVACGYLVVGGATTFGDWGVIFGATAPPWLWRVALIALGLFGYLAGLQGLARLYASIAGPEGFDAALLWRRTLLPGAAAAVIACAAEAAGRSLTLSSMGLSLGCTAFVGWTLSRLGDFKPSPSAAMTERLALPLRLPWVLASLLVSAIFVALVGPGAAAAL
jgi:hypothetical protein